MREEMRKRRPIRVVHCPDKEFWKERARKWKEVNVKIIVEKKFPELKEDTSSE